MWYNQFSPRTQNWQKVKAGAGARISKNTKPEEQEPEQELAKGQSWSHNQLVPVLIGAEPGSNTQIYKFQSKTCL